LKLVRLKKNKAHFIHRKHPYIFSGAIGKMENNIEVGEAVQVQSAAGEFLAIAQYFTGSLALRVISFELTSIDDAFWDRKISNAFQLRELYKNTRLADTDCYRLIHGEGDFLPGLVVDIYGHTAVIQCHTIGMLRQLQPIKKSILRVLGSHISHIYNKSADLISDEYLVENEYLYGEDQAAITVMEHGHIYQVDIAAGQKTGFFLDQRDSRKLIKCFVKGKSVLNTFCYTGGFSIAALAAGATNVHSIDQSQAALDTLHDNLRLNSMEAARHDSTAADVLTFLKDSVSRFDVIIVDPPAYAKSKAKRHKAVQAYKRLNALAIKKVKPQGIIFTFSCSQAVDPELFHSTILAAAIESGRQIRVLHLLQQPFDHPVSIYCQEKRYLKGMVIQVD